MMKMQNNEITEIINEYIKSGCKIENLHILKNKLAELIDIDGIIHWFDKNNDTMFYIFPNGKVAITKKLDDVVYIKWSDGYTYQRIFYNDGTFKINVLEKP